jgi:hypothetical protein
MNRTRLNSSSGKLMIAGTVQHGSEKKHRMIILPGNPARHLSVYSGSAAMLLSENGRKIERKNLRLILRPIAGIVYSERTQEEQA